MLLLLKAWIRMNWISKAPADLIQMSLRFSACCLQLGRRMAELPVDPMLSKMILASEQWVSSSSNWCVFSQYYRRHKHSLHQKCLLSSSVSKGLQIVAILMSHLMFSHFAPVQTQQTLTCKATCSVSIVSNCMNVWKETKKRRLVFDQVWLNTLTEWSLFFFQVQVLQWSADNSSHVVCKQLHFLPTQRQSCACRQRANELRGAWRRPPCAAECL